MANWLTWTFNRFGPGRLVLKLKRPVVDRDRHHSRNGPIDHVDLFHGKKAVVFGRRAWIFEPYTIKTMRPPVPTFRPLQDFRRNCSGGTAGGGPPAAAFTNQGPQKSLHFRSDYSFMGFVARDSSPWDSPSPGSDMGRLGTRLAKGTSRRPFGPLCVLISAASVGVPVKGL